MTNIRILIDYTHDRYEFQVDDNDPIIYDRPEKPRAYFADWVCWNAHMIVSETTIFNEDSKFHFHYEVKTRPIYEIAEQN